ncbi:MAG: SWIM zinc finger family protein [Cyanophyceae cyanobacterium]
MDEYGTTEREWWVQGWLDLLASYRFKKRLERARNYARQGNVLSIEFRGAKVLARVQGTEPSPYRVSLSLDPFSDEDWQHVCETLAGRAVWAAKLLAGEMPHDIESVFASNGLSLFPFSLGDVHSKCSCPDEANPCKHIGAVYYLLADRFSEDPFVLFQLRGRSQEAIIEALRGVRSRARVPEPSEPSEPSNLAESPSSADDSPTLRPVDAATALVLATQETPIRVDAFWSYDEPLEADLAVIAPSPDAGTPCDLLGEIPLPTSTTGSAEGRQLANRAVMQYLDEVYRTASQQAIIAALGN